MQLSELDYYAILDVPRSSTKAEIVLAYRKLAVRLCPTRDPCQYKNFVPMADDGRVTHLDPIDLNKQWNYINMAYDVLSNDLHRAIYDRYGESGLLQGVLLPNGYFPPYQYHGDNMKVYHDVFGTFSPYANLIDGLTNPPPLYTNKAYGIGVKTKDPPVEKRVALDLEEVRSGCVKIMNLIRLEFVDNEQIVTEKRKKTLKLNIKPGTTAGTRYTFKEEGDRNATKIPSDVIFIVEDKPHPCFKRDNLHDLIYTYKINLCQALVGFKFVIETLDKRKLKLSITNVVYPGYQKIIPGEGLPKCKVTDPAEDLKPNKSEPLQYGDLIVKFEIEFPTYLNNEMKMLCRKFFDEVDQIAPKENQSKQNVIKLY